MEEKKGEISDRTREREGEREKQRNDHTRNMIWKKKKKRSRNTTAPLSFFVCLLWLLDGFVKQ